VFVRRGSTFVTADDDEFVHMLVIVRLERERRRNMQNRTSSSGRSTVANGTKTTAVLSAPPHGCDERAICSHEMAIERGSRSGTISGEYCLDYFEMLRRCCA
jgi:hypothetical protein